MQGGHSKRPKENKVPAELIKQGEHSKPPKDVKEEWDIKKAKWVGDDKEGNKYLGNHTVAAKKHYNNWDDSANHHIGPTASHVQDELEARHAMHHLSDAERNRVHEYSDSSWHLNGELYRSHTEGRRPDPVYDEHTKHLDSALKNIN